MFHLNLITAILFLTISTFTVNASENLKGGKEQEKTDIPKSNRDGEDVSKEGIMAITQFSPDKCPMKGKGKEPILILSRSVSENDTEEDQENDKKIVDEHGFGMIILKLNNKVKLEQSVKDLPMAARDLMKTIQIKVQDKLNGVELTKIQKKELIKGLKNDLDRLMETGELNLAEHAVFEQLVAEALLTNTFSGSMKAVAGMMKGFNLYSLNLDLNSSLFNKPLTLIPLQTTNQSVAMGITEMCKMIPDVNSALNRKSTYADIRSEVMTENKVGNINPHSPNYQFVDKTVMPFVLNIGCGTLVSTAVSAGCSLAYSVGVRSLDPTSFKGSLVIGATSLLTTSIAQALLKERVLQKGGIKVGKDIVMKTSILDISMGTLRFAKDSLSSLYNMVSSTEGMEEMLDMGPM